MANTFVCSQLVTFGKDWSFDRNYKDLDRLDVSRIALDPVSFKTMLKVRDIERLDEGTIEKVEKLEDKVKKNQRKIERIENAAKYRIPAVLNDEDKANIATLEAENFVTRKTLSDLYELQRLVEKVKTVNKDTFEACKNAYESAAESEKAVIGVIESAIMKVTYEISGFKELIKASQDYARFLLSGVRNDDSKKSYQAFCSAVDAALIDHFKITKDTQGAICKAATFSFNQAEKLILANTFSSARFVLVEDEKSKQRYASLRMADGATPRQFCLAILSKMQGVKLVDTELAKLVAAATK